MLLWPGIACVDQTPPAVAIQPRAITYGSVDLEHPNVGLLNRPGGHYCSATLIGSRSVLTAAHCVETEGEYSFELEQEIYPAQDVIAHPLYIHNVMLPELPGAGSVWYDNDLGVVLLSEEVLGLHPARILREPPLLGEAITLVGFGTSTQGTARIKHYAENVIGALGEKYFLYGNSLGLIGGPATTCIGDSGGPTFIAREGTEQLLGVHSMSGPSCEGYGYDMRVGYFIDWLTEATGQNLGVIGDNAPPTVAFMDLPRQIYQATPLTVTVEAQDEETRVVSIELRLDSVLVGSATESPGSFELTALALGDHDLEAMAADERGNRARAVARITVISSERPEGGAEQVSDGAVDLNNALDLGPTAGGCRLHPSGEDGSPLGWVLLLMTVWGVRVFKILFIIFTSWFKAGAQGGTRCPLINSITLPSPRPCPRMPTAS